MSEVNLSMISKEQGTIQGPILTQRKDKTSSHTLASSRVLTREASFAQWVRQRPQWRRGRLPQEKTGTSYTGPSRSSWLRIRQSWNIRRRQNNRKHGEPTKKLIEDAEEHKFAKKGASQLVECAHRCYSYGMSFAFHSAFKLGARRIAKHYNTPASPWRRSSIVYNYSGTGNTHFLVVKYNCQIHYLISIEERNQKQIQGILGTFKIFLFQTLRIPTRHVRYCSP